MEFARFMSSPIGRSLRVLAGVVLVLVGFVVVGGGAGMLIATVGALPVIAGAANFCVAAPLFGGPFWT